MSIDISEPVSALNKLSDLLGSRLESALKEQADTIEKQARTVHRYQKRTGKLQQATVAEATRSEITGYLDEGIAHYGKYVHDGQRSWAPDPFLDNAFHGADFKIRVAAEKAFDSAIIGAGLS